MPEIRTPGGEVIQIFREDFFSGAEYAGRRGNREGFRLLVGSVLIVRNRDPVERVRKGRAHWARLRWP